MRYLASVKVADLFTLANGMLGFIAITYIIDRNFLFASFLILVAMVMDGLDGYIARKMGTERAIGRALDSISDSISFCIAPALLVYGIFYNKDFDWVSMLLGQEAAMPYIIAQNVMTLIAAAMLAIFGIMRLVRYAREDFSADTFLGLPTPATALAVILLTYLLSGENGSFFYIYDLPWVVLPACIAISILMISDVPYPKARGWVQKATLAGIALAAIPAVVAVFDLIFELKLSIFTLQAISISAFVLIFGYIVGGPLVARQTKNG